MKTEAFSARRCIFELKDKKLNPYYLIEIEKMDIAAFKTPAIAIQDSYADANGLRDYLEMIRRAQ